MISKQEAIERYGKVPLKFSSYYKYSFAFSGVAEDGAKISALYGGDHDAIYRFDCTPETTITLTDENAYYAAYVSLGDDEILSHYDF